MDFKRMGEEIIAKAIKWGAGEAEACLENIRSFEVNVRKGEIETLRRSVSRGLGLRVFVERQLGFAYSSDLSAGAVDETIRKAIELARITEPKPWQGLPDFGPQSLANLDLYDSDLASVADDRKIVLAREVEKIAMAEDKRITNSEGGSFSDSEREFGLFSSKGISNLMRETRCSFGVYVVAGEGDNMQGGGWSSSKRFFKELAPVDKIAKTAAKRAVDQLGPKPVATKKVPVIFDRYAAPAFWMGVGSALNGDAVFRKATFLTDYLEKAIVSPLITAVDDPTIPRFISSVPFDGEGQATRKNVIVDKGILKTFVYDSQTARKAGVKVNTMTGRDGYRSSPFATFMNVVVENGKDSFESLFKDVKEGLYVRAMRGTGTDMTTGSFSVGCSGFWIVDGAIAHPVDGITIGGSALEILKGIDKVADDLDMRGGINSPSFRVAEITVGGRRG
jgi:PmbA protein